MWLRFADGYWQPLSLRKEGLRLNCINTDMEKMLLVNSTGVLNLVWLHAQFRICSLQFGARLVVYNQFSHKASQSLILKSV